MGWAGLPDSGIGSPGVRAGA